MRIGIEACTWGNRRGYGRFTRELVGAMVRGYPEHEFTLVLDEATASQGEFPERPSAGDTYQIETALEAFANGGLMGRGPGEGIGKRVLPDAHTDFIFAVAGEEFGLVVCVAVVALFAFVTLRGYRRLMGEDSLFIMLAAGGLLTQFGLQAVINMGVNLRLLPTKGMTLPFISYGGSSLVGLAIGMGMVIALTRRRPRREIRR